MPLYVAESFPSARTMLSDLRVRKLRLNFSVASDEFFLLAREAGENVSVHYGREGFILYRDATGNSSPPAI